MRMQFMQLITLGNIHMSQMKLFQIFFKIIYVLITFKLGNH